MGDVTGDGRISIDLYIEGLQRLKTPVQGIDVAAAKSIMRGLYLDASEMNKKSLLLHEALLEVVCQTHGVIVTGSDRLDAESSGDEEANDIITSARERVLMEENLKSRARISKLQALVQSR